MPKATNPSQNVRMIQRGIITTHGLLSVRNWVYLLSLLVAAVASVRLWRLFIASGEKVRQLEHYKTEAAERIASGNAAAEGAKAEAARANERAAVLEKEAAETRIEKEQLKLRNRDLELQIKRISNRKLSSEQIAAIKSACEAERFKPLITFNFANDPEAERFTQILANAIHSGGCRVKGGASIMGGGAHGLTVFDPSGAVQRVLTSGGLTFTEATNSMLNQGVFITVGQRSAE